MKGEPERLPEIISLQKHFTSPELIDHDYWNCRSVQSEDKENEAVLSVYENNKNQVANGEMSAVKVDHAANEVYNFSNEIIIEQDSEMALPWTDCHYEEDLAFHRFFVCHYCGNIWSNISQLMLHLESAHPSELEVDIESHTIYNLGISQLHSCLYCDYTTEAFEPLVEHIKSSHRVVNENCCPHCDYRTMLQTSLKDHIFQKHRDSCLYCILNIHS